MNIRLSSLIFALCALTSRVTPAQSIYEPYCFSTLAGLAGSSGAANGSGALASFNQPWGLAVDGAGTIYVADTLNQTIRKITAGGVVSTLAGTAGVAGFADSPGPGMFNRPTGVAVDASGNVYVADYNNQRIRKITSAGVVTTLAGSGATGTANGTPLTAQFHNPFGLALDSAGSTLYVADQNNQLIRKIDLASGLVSTFAGAGTGGSHDDANNLLAQFNTPRGIAVDHSGNVFVADAGNLTVRKIASGGGVTTIAGAVFVPGFNDGPGNAARFSTLQPISPFGGPCGVAVDSSGNVYVTDQGNNTLRKIASNGNVTTLAGVVSVAGSADGTGIAAGFNLPAGVAVDGAGTVYVADTVNHTIRVECPTALTNAPILVCVTNKTVLSGSVWDFDMPSLIGSSASNLAVSVLNTVTNVASSSTAITRTWQVTGFCVSGTNTWSPLSSGVNGEVWALLEMGGNLYAGGVFTTAGGVSANHIAKWDGTSWSPLGTGPNNGVNGGVYALATFGGKLYAGGYFTTAGGVPAQDIAQWDGASWSPLGTGLVAYSAVEALAVIGTDLYVGGGFTVAAGGPGNLVAKFNTLTSVWSPVGTGMNDRVNSLTVIGNDLYAGGQFTNAGGISANFVAKWNGANWSALGSGMNFRVGGGLGVLGGNLYAGGLFTIAGGTPANRVAKWNVSTSTWSALGVGVDNAVEGFATMGTDLYVSGSFYTAGGANAYSIAKWDGSNWSSLGSGMNDGVWRLAVNGSDLYAGGVFTTAGGLSANHVAKWGASCVPTTLTCSQTVTVLTSTSTPCAACETWTAHETNRIWSAVASSADGSKLVAGDYNGKLYTSTDYGATWTPHGTNQTWWALASDASGSKLVAAATGAQIYTSTDSGVTWTPRDANRYWTSVASSANGNNLVATANGGLIYTSTDSGVTWSPQPNSGAQQWNSVASSADGTHLVAVANNALVYTSADSGVTWTPRSNSGAGLWRAVASSADGTHLVAAMFGGHIYTSTDTGATWTARDANRSWIGLASSADGTKLFAVEYNGQIYCSTDSGATWAPHDTTRNWDGIAASSDGSKLVAVVYGGGQIYTAGCPTITTCVPVPANMVLWLPFDETGGATSANLFTGGNNGAQINSPISGAGYVAGALGFDGVSQYVSVPDYAGINPGTGDLTLDAWVRRATNSGASTTRVIVDKRDPATYIGYSFVVNSGNLLFQMTSTAFNFINYRDTSAVPADGQWHFVAVTMSRGKTNSAVQFYVDGAPTALVSSTAVPGSLNNTTPLRVGSSPVAGADPWMGGLDEVEEFNRALGASEIAALFNAGPAGKCKTTVACLPPPAKMVLWLPFDETTGALSANLALGGNHGVHINSPMVTSGYVAHSLTFDGVSQSVSVASYSAINPSTGDLSLDAWVKRDPSGGNSPPRIILDKRDPQTGVGYSLAVSFGNLLFQMAGTSSGFTNYRDTGTLPADNQWHLVAVTVSRGATNGGRFYIDGAPTGLFDPTGHPDSLNNTNAFIVGNTPVGGAAPWMGSIDEVEMFNRNLQASEIAAIFNAGAAGKCKPASPVIYGGSEHFLLGQATLAVALDPTNVLNNTLTLGNLGNSGNDGVLIQWGDGAAGFKDFDLHINPIDSGGTLPVGAFLKEQLVGDSPTITNGGLGSAQITKMGAGLFTLSADFSPIGASASTVEVYRNGALVARMTGQSGQALATVSAWPTSFHISYPPPDAGFDFDAAVAITLGSDSKTVVMGDDLRIIPEGVSLNISLASVYLTASQIPSLTLTSEAVLPALLRATFSQDTVFGENLTLEWFGSGQLQESDDLIHWTNVAGATSPFSVSPNKTAHFYRGAFNLAK